MKIKLVIIIMLMSVTDAFAHKNNRISVTDFGAHPDDKKNDLVAFNKAIDFSRNNPGTILYFPPGVYDIANQEAIKLMDDILTGVIEGNSQDLIFQPYYPYPIGLDLEGVTDLSIEAAGATILVEGWMEPISIRNSKKVRISGLTIDYKRRPSLEGIITEVGKETYTVLLSDTLAKLDPNMPLNRILYIDKKSKRISNREDYFPKFTLGDGNTLKIQKSIQSEFLGKGVMIPQTFHFRPAILILEASNIELVEVTIHSQPGMGIVGHRSENILMEGLRIIPPAGRSMSTNTDATHFTSCKGYIKYINCQFEGHGDDAANIHNYYHQITKGGNEDKYILELRDADWHAGVLDSPDIGDEMELVKRSSLEVMQKVHVTEVQKDIPNLSSIVSFDQPLPANIKDYLIINSSRLPNVEIKGCTVSSNRARGFLIKTRNVLIEHNQIWNSTGTGIHVGAEGSWHEGPTAENIKIRCNRIINTGTGAGTINNTSGIAVVVHAQENNIPGLHKNILIEGNIIEGLNSENGIYISGAEDVIIRYNEISGCKMPINISNSNNVKLYSNTSYK